ncbi:hypothetical protein D3C71_264470 [compost metagenome]
MSGYTYGEQVPIEECGLCGGHARAEFCDVGVGMVQIEPFHCLDCGAELNPLVNGEYLPGWVLPAPPSSRGERVTGYYITSKGTPLEMTFDDDHDAFNRRAGTSTSELLWRGWIRITLLEGYAIDLPQFMSTKARRTLGRVLKTIEAESEMGDPYVRMQGEDFGSEMPRPSIMSLVSRLPTERVAVTPAERSPA